MAQSHDSRSISTTLLQRLREQDGDAYRRLQYLFQPTVVVRLKRLGVRAGDVDDLTQEVFLRIWKSLKRFRRDSPQDSFRRWLLTIVRNVANDYFRRPLPGGLGTDQLAQLPECVEGDTAAERAWEVHRMLEAIRGDFMEETFQVFVRYWLEGHDSDRLTRDFGMTKGAVREARSRVMRRLREEYRDLYGKDEWPFSGNEDAA